MKKVFVLWSAGVDSTYLILYLLQKGYKVDAGYIKLLQNEKQTIRELEAINRLLPLIDDVNFTYRGVLNEVNIVNSGNVILNQIPIFITALYHLEKYEEFAMGFIMNDDTISWIPEIIACYEGFRPLVCNLPKLTFPLIKLKKATLYNSLPIKIQKQVEWCEDEDDKYDPETKKCDSCHSCKRMEYELSFS